MKQPMDDFLKRFEVLCKMLNLREETVSGFDEQGAVRNFIANELALRDQELIEKIEEMKIPVDIHKNGGILTRKEITCNSVLTDVSEVVRNR